jgi:quercetin dioxygenase-like cupin family protein
MMRPLSAQEIANADDQIGTELVKETDAMRIWHLRLAPGESLPPHRHARPYFWTVLTDGLARSRRDDGHILDVRYRVGDTADFPALGPDNAFVHDLTNIGESELLFVTVEFKNQERQL